MNIDGGIAIIYYYVLSGGNIFIGPILAYIFGRKINNYIFSICSMIILLCIYPGFIIMMNIIHGMKNIDGRMIKVFCLFMAINISLYLIGILVKYYSNNNSRNNRHIK
jgi:ethanolamine transporter EutH